MNQSEDPNSHGISLVLPVYNEEESLPRVLRETVSVLRDLKRPFEILCVNDGAVDDSQQVLETFASQEGPELRIIRFDQNRGQSAAFAAGFQQARYPWVVTMDADGQNDPRDIPRLLEATRSSDNCCGYGDRP